MYPSKALFKATTSTKFLHTSKKEIQLNNYRVRRQIPEDHANQYFINIILFADTSMSDHYGNELENYLKLVMAKVSRIFKHFSIGHPIAFGSVNIKKTNENFLDPDKYPMNSIILENFCKWQSTQTINPDMKNLNDSYVALLLTRNIICLSSHGDKNCEGAGHANSGTICNQNLSCGVINDGSFSTELTIAHEVGHLLGMRHDNYNKACLINDNSGSLYLMNHEMTEKHPKMWSNCSNDYVTRFFETGKGDCLLAEPKEIFNETEYGHLGEHYSLDKICEFAWGLGFYAAPAFDDNEKCIS
ncbi:A disintegrin and metalloproteinase with thrombospondin motifs 1-like [Aphidius gifuensis]|uniref:A disintegrin and metalloproteinase with thrombospondin motifs 1-like n=1 Tax=Aphidius gifuensis TaxID=684658 RepID=UPI001CDB8F35|nr:A disintegrin and metalloproteinase with thrombospondin motifs 1-like [Aphidius gifuensis]